MQYLTSELEAVRKQPDVYIGALGNHGLKNMYREIIQYLWLIDFGRLPL